MSESISLRYSDKQIKEMKEVCLHNISFKSMVESRTKVEPLGEWYGVQCEFHPTSTMDAGRLRDNDETQQGVYFCNNPNCEVHLSPYDGRLNMFQYWQLANSMETEEDAVLDLYHKYLGKPLPEPEGEVLTEEEILAIQKNERKRILRLYALFYWHKALFEEVGQEGLKYLTEERKLPIEMINKYYIGYAPGGNKLITFLESVGFTREEIREVGLMSKKGNDLYWGRVIIPLFSMRNNVLSPNFDPKNADIPNFYSRMLSSYIKDNKDKALKHRYLNRNFPLFNFSEARRKTHVIMPEGCIDTISGQIFIDRLCEMEKKGELSDDFTIKPSQLGVFASYGTNGFSEKDHLPIVQKANFQVIYLAGDNDKNFAGQTANIKRGKMLQRGCPNTEVRIVLWPENDLNDLLIANTDPVVFLRTLENSVSLEEYEILVALQKSGDTDVIRNQFEAARRIDKLFENLDLSCKENIIKYKKTFQILSEKLNIDVSTILFHAYTKSCKDQFKKQAEEIGVPVDLFILTKIAEIQKVFE